MRVALLGSLELRTSAGGTVEIGGARLRMLLARLALDAGRVVPTAALVDGLWGGRAPTDASNALQSLVSRLRKVMPDGLLESHPVGYRLAVRPEHVDVVRFERLATQGRTELRAGQHRQASATLAEALRLWRGAALADVADAPFAQPVAIRLAEARVTALADRIEADLALGKHVELAAELEGLVAEHPLSERLAGLRIRALYGAGRQGDALAAYEHIRRDLAEQLGLDPTPELQAVHLAVLRRDPELTPRRDPPTLLPRSTARARLTSFVGRDADLAKVLALLATSRLVCLIGAGGAGKTRLATEVTSVMDERDGPGVWFAELAPVGAETDLAAAVLTTLGVGEVQILDRGHPHQPRTATQRLVDVFSAQHGVLVLDNCEHLIGAAATLTDELLSQCPQLRILATSREPLAITGEALHWVGPLELPDESASPDEARDAPAVRLFVDRASAARPGFALDTDTLPVVTQICRRLDGMPLALELAAARLRAMTVDQVATRLDDRFRLLTGGNRTALPRHRTLRAVVDWSWELLTQDEHKLARRLAVLVGGATAEAATQVCAGSDLAAADVPYLLASLVEKSLLDMTEGADRAPRYRMLETVRAYGMERLTDAGEVETTQAAFVRYCTEVVERAEPVMRTSGQLGAVAMLRAERDNIIAALRQAVDSGESEAAVRITVAMSYYWIFSSNESEARAWIRSVMGLRPDTPAAAVAVLSLASAAFEVDPARRAEAATRALAACQETNALEAYPVLALLEPVVGMITGDDEAGPRAAQHAETHPDPWVRAISLLTSAFIADNAGDAAQFEANATQAAVAFRAMGERWGLSMALVALSKYWSLLGDHQVAIAGYEEAAQLGGELGSMADVATIRVFLAGARIASGNFDAAEQDLREALTSAIRDGLDEVRFIALCGLARLARERAEFDQAWEHVTAAGQVLACLRTDAGIPHQAAIFGTTKAGVALATGDIEAATTALSECLPRAVESRDMPVVASVGEWIARLVMLRGDAASAAELLGATSALRGMAIAGDPDVRRTEERLVEQLGVREYLAAFGRSAAYSKEHAIGLLHDALGRPVPA